VSGGQFSINGLTLPLVLAGGQSKTFNVVAAPSTPGSEMGKLAILSNASNAELDVALSVSGSSSVPVISPAYFGMHIHQIGTYFTTPPPISFGSFRIWDSGFASGWAGDIGWDTIERNAPMNGVHQYDWSQLDRAVAVAQANGAQVLMEIARIPTWASSFPTMPVCTGGHSEVGCCWYNEGSCAPPCDLAAGTSCPDGSNVSTVCADGTEGNCEFKAFVDALTKRYQGKIGEYELWNEPHNAWFWFSGTEANGVYSYDFNLAISNLVSITHDAYLAIRRNDPAARIISPSGEFAPSGNAPAFMDAYMSKWFASDDDNFDIVGFHYYDHADNQVTVPERFVASALPQIKSVIAKYPTGSLPIWNTEGSDGGGSKWLLTADQKTGFPARRAIVMWNNAIARFHWYAFDEAVTDGANLVDPTTGLTSAGFAYEFIHDWLVGASMPNPCNLNGGTTTNATYTCDIFRSGGYQGRIVWSTDGSTTSWPGTGYSTYRDLNTNSKTAIPSSGEVPIGNSPVLLE
jgi:hypothetical protein